MKKEKALPIVLKGKMRILYDEFSKMPRGQISLKIAQKTTFKKDNFTPYNDLVLLFTKDTGKGGDTMVYKVTEKEITTNKNSEVKFETFHSDDFIQLELF